jgi:hypothetical protein
MLIPRCAWLAVTAAVSTFTFPGSEIIGALSLVNAGTEDIWFTLDGTIPTALDSGGNGKLSEGEAVNIGNCNIAAILAICAAGKSSNLKILYTRETQGA